MVFHVVLTSSEDGDCELGPFDARAEAMAAAKSVSREENSGVVHVTRLGRARPLCVFEDGKMVACSCPDAVPIKRSI
jgi:hypothetical protein